MSNGEIEITKAEDFFGLFESLEQKAQEYYEGLNSSALRIAEQFINLYPEMIMAISSDQNDFIPAFQRKSDVGKVLLLATCGCLKALRVSKQLLLQGHFIEMHNVVRVVEQWSECILLAEGNPALASKILEKGVSRRRDNKVLRNHANLKTIYEAMDDDFAELSQSAHITPALIRLNLTPEGKVIVGAVASEKMFRIDALGIATMAKNSLTLIIRHFEKLPTSWLLKYEKAKANLLAENPQIKTI